MVLMLVGSYGCLAWPEVEGAAPLEPHDLALTGASPAARRKPEPNAIRSKAMSLFGAAKQQPRAQASIMFHTLCPVPERSSGT